MTAIKDVTLPNGLETKGAIHRIESISMGYKNNATYTARIYVSLEKPFFTEITGSITYAGGDIYEECYEDLMSKGDYTKA